MPLELDADVDVAWRIREVVKKPYAIDADDIIDAYAIDALNTDVEQLGRDYEWDEVDVDYVDDELGRAKPNKDPHVPSASLADSLEIAEDTYSELQKDRIMLVGAGAASLLLASYLTLRGVPQKHITIADPRGNYGGTWQDAWKQAGGFNNPRALQFSPDRHLSLEDRNGKNMIRFLRKVAKDHLGKVTLLPEEVVGAQRTRKGKWVTRTGDGKEQRSDYLILANGTPAPRPIDGKRLKSNLDTAVWQAGSSELIVERYQRQLKRKELGSGRPIVLLGLGNSTAAMVHMIQEYEDKHRVTVPYFVVTDHTRSAIKHPRRAIDGDRSIFRDPEDEYFTGYSGDLKRDRKAFKRMREEGRILTEANEVNFDTQSGKLIITTSRGQHTVKRPHVFALLGYERDDTLFKAVGAVKKKHKQPKIRASDGAVRAGKDKYASNVFAIGAAAASRRNTNAAVIPGIFAQVPATVMTMAVRSMVRHADL